MQCFSAVDHAEERGESYVRVGVVGPFDEAGDHSQRQHGRNRGDQYRVGGSEDTFRQQRETCRAVEKHQIEVTAQRVEEGRDQAFWLAKGVEEPFELAVCEVGRQQMQVAIIGLLDGRGQRLAVLETLLAEA